MVKSKGLIGFLSVLLASGALALGAAQAKEFTYDPKVNEQMAKRIKIPVYFAVPASARLPLSGNIDTTDRLVDFKHPDAQGAEGDVGLRLVVAKRAGLLDWGRGVWAYDNTWYWAAAQGHVTDADGRDHVTASCRRATSCSPSAPNGAGAGPIRTSRWASAIPASPS